MKQSDLKKLLNAALLHTENGIDILEGDTNPQIKAIVLNLKGRREAFDAVRQTLEGNHTILKLFAQ